MNPGVRLGPYEIGARIGAGGMGEVFQALDTRLKRQVAIKVLPAALANDHERLARFQREAELLAQLNHPHIAAIYSMRASAAAELHGGHGMTCAAPLDPMVLADYWLGALSEADEATVEAHLLTCDVCGDALREVIAMADALRQVAGSGLLRMVVTDAFVQQARVDGRVVRESAASPGQGVACTVSADDDLLVSRLAVDLAQAARVDLVMLDGTGRELARRRDLPVRREAQTLLLQEPMAFAKASPTMTMVMRLLAVDGDVERPLGEYVFNHTRTLPGPGHLDF